MWPGSGYEGWFLVEGSVFEHAVDHVAAPTREADDGGVVVFALFAFALVIGHGGRVFGGCDERVFCFNVCSTGSAVFFRSVG